jgi:ATP-dependent Lon protease
MDLPSEMPVMVLPNAILFPQAMLPLHIFEPRYRQMLSDSLNSHRMFSVAMQKPGLNQEKPSNIAGVGLIRVSVSNRDGTSHLILQGIARVELVKTIRYKPYRVQRIRPLKTTAIDSVAVDALAAKVLELVTERIEQGINVPAHWFKHISTSTTLPEVGDSHSQVLKQLLKYFSKLEDPDYMADMVSCALLPNAETRQVILATTNLEERLKHLIHFLMAEIRSNRKPDKL